MYVCVCVAAVSSLGGLGEGRVWWPMPMSLEGFGILGFVVGSEKGDGDEDRRGALLLATSNFLPC